ncbi:MAG: ribonuclease [Gammaproteobacteria bacterium]|jgi:dsRNA-specific ribonuclease|nr:ribonuclease [Gammaproteobacteria bacterium]
MSATFSNNPKNDLLEISQSYFGAARPEYAHFPYGPPHDAVFLCICTFQDEITSHQGRTKKEAEKFCSSDMIKKVQENFFDKVHNIWRTSEKTRDPLFSEIDTHVHNLSKAPNFQALHLLGNAVLRSYISAYLFCKYSCFQEDLLTHITSHAMNQNNRASLALDLGFKQYLDCGATAKKLVEFLDAAIGILALQDREGLCMRFLNAGYQKFIEKTVKIVFEDKAFSKQQSKSGSYIQTSIHNYKSDLFNLVQKRGARLPTYQTTEITGSDHNPSFTVCCDFKASQTIGYGKSIKSAEQDASKKMLELLRKSEINVTRTIGYSAHKKYGSSIEYKPLTESERAILGKILGCKTVGDSIYLDEALTHPSAKNEANYQRLEFLGDALLREILLSHILQTSPSLSKKGDIEESMSILVSASTQADIAKKLKLNKYIWAETSVTESILSDALEALIATIYLDKNTLLSVSTCVVTWYKDRLNNSFRGNISESGGSSSGLSSKGKKPLLMSDTFVSIPTAKKLTSSEVIQKTYTVENKYPLFQPSTAEKYDKIAVSDIDNQAKCPSLSKKGHG